MMDRWEWGDNKNTMLELRANANALPPKKKPKQGSRYKN